MIVNYYLHDGLARSEIKEFLVDEEGVVMKDDALNRLVEEIRDQFNEKKFELDVDKTTGEIQSITLIR